MRIKAMLAVCNAFAILAMFLVIAIYIPAFSMNFYRAEYTKYGIPQHIGVSEDQLIEVTKRLTDYMRGRAEDLVITAEVNGVTREFFDERDKAHMVDVKELFDVASAAFILAAVVFVLTWALLRNDARLVFRMGLWTLAGGLAFFAGLTFIISLDFDSAFVRFHLIFFDNDLWILDPAVSLLINIVPQEFFVDIAIRVALIFGGFILGYAGLMAVLLRKWKCS